MLKHLIKNAYILAIISSILCILSFPPFNLSFLIWFALVPFLYSLTITPFKKKIFYKIPYYDSIIISFIFSFIFYSSTLYWIFFLFKFNSIFIYLLLSCFTIIFGFLFNLTYHKYNKTYLIFLISPLFWTSIEFIKSECWWLKFTWMNIGYSQHNILPILQFANILGQYGLTALIIFINSLIVYIILNLIKLNKKNKTKKEKTRLKKHILNSIIILILFITTILTYGTIQLNKTYTRNIDIALIQDESFIFSNYLNLISKIDKNVDFILLPEYTLQEVIYKNDTIMNQIKNITNKYNSYFVIGSVDQKPEMKEHEFHNTAYLFNSSGDIIGRYYKRVPIQLLDDGLSGDEYPIFKTKHGNLGIIICYDMDYSFVARNVVKNGAEFLFIPTYDSITWSSTQHKQHSSMASMRAVENARFIARPSTSGISQIISPNGSVLHKININESGFIIGSIQKISHQTIYTKIGYTFPYFCLFFSILILFILFFKLYKKN
jgi:apolipoprotein N-acyltransferase